LDGRETPDAPAPSSRLPPGSPARDKEFSSRQVSWLAGRRRQADLPDEFDHQWPFLRLKTHRLQLREQLRTGSSWLRTGFPV